MLLAHLSKLLIEKVLIAKAEFMQKLSADKTAMRAIGIVFLVTFIFSSQAVSLARAPDPEDLKKLKIQKFSPSVKAPEFALKDLEGKEVSLDMYRGKPLMLYFWATW